MGLHIATGLDRLVRRTETKALRAGRLNIGTRLMLGFGLIILSMMVVDAVVLWQFNAIRTRAGRLREIDQKRLAILRVHASLLEFNDRLNTLADSEDATRLRVEAGSLRSTVLDDIRGATSTFGPSRSPPSEIRASGRPFTSLSARCHRSSRP